MDDLYSFTKNLLLSLIGSLYFIEKISLYTADEIRRLATETIIPYLLEKKRSHDKKKAIGKAKKQDTTLDNLIEETQMDDMELFDGTFNFNFNLKGEIVWEYKKKSCKS